MTKVSDLLVMGTVQIGLPYGRKAESVLCSVSEAERILEAGWSHGIRTFDTACGYGESVCRLSNWLQKQKRISECQIVTKIPAKDCSSLAAVSSSIKPFAGAVSISVLTHGFVPEGSWKQFAAICTELEISPGQSVYSAEEVRRCAGMGVTKVQAPGNVLDFQQMRVATECGISLDIRSVFLQGNLLATPPEAEKRVPGLKGICECIGQVAEFHGVSKVSLLINAVLANVSPAMRLVIGADNPLEISEWVSALDEDKKHGRDLAQQIREKFGRFISQSMIDPRLWK
jgi:aryl-alcohol dehydrogenase-like predicted oxidoreductase